MTKHRDKLMTAMENMELENEQLREENQKLKNTKAIYEKEIDSIERINFGLEEEIKALKEEINKLTLDKRYIINIKENMRKLLGEE